MRVWLGIIGLAGSLLSWSQVEPPSRLVYAWISNNDQFESLLVVNNHGAQAAAVTLTARRAEGDPETVSRTIPAGGFLQETASDLFPALGQGLGFTVVVAAEEENLAGRWITFQRETVSRNSPSQGVAADLRELEAGSHHRLGHNLLFGYLPVIEDFFAAPVIVNVGTAPADVVLIATNTDGGLVLRDDQTLRALEPNRPFAILMSQLVTGAMEPLNVVAVSSQPLTGVSFVFNSNGEPSIGNASGIPVPPESTSFSFSFEQETHGWTGGFADYPVGEETFYELVFDHRDLPENLAGGKALFLSGNNHSDDLFMFVKGMVTGLEGNANYQASIRVDFASNAGAGCLGVGGAPGESVYLKAGVSAFEPLAIDEDGFYVMNIDKGNQSQGGRAMQVLGDLSVPTDCADSQFLFKTLVTTGAPLPFKTDPSGTLWLAVGTDSGFESTTALYITGIQAYFFRVP